MKRWIKEIGDKKLDRIYFDAGYGNKVWIEKVPNEKNPNEFFYNGYNVFVRAENIIHSVSSALGASVDEQADNLIEDELKKFGVENFRKLSYEQICEFAK